MKLSLADKEKIKRIGYSKILNLSCGSCGISVECFCIKKTQSLREEDL